MTRRLTLKDAISFLENSLSPALFGVGEAKPWEDLIEEVKRGECEIWENKGLPIRIVRVAFIQIKSHQNQFLMEDRQEFADGRIRKRNLKGVSEKIKFGKDPFAEAVRALKEELGIDVERSLLRPIFVNSSNSSNVEERIENSPSYPGLRSQYEIHHFRYELPAKDWKEQFIENQPNKATYFLWK